MWRRLLQSGSGALLDLIAPVRCPLCGEPLEADARCPRCRLPQAGWVVRRLGNDRSGPYLWMAGGRYAGRWRRVVLAAKYGGDPGALRLLAHQARRALPRGLAWDGLVPVPAHPVRARERGGEPVLGLARRVGAQGGLPVRRLLARTSYTPRLAGRGRAERHRLLAGAFRAAPAEGALLLVDDIATSGATWRSCRHALLGAGARSVDLLVAALTPRCGPERAGIAGAGGVC